MRDSARPRNIGLLRDRAPLTLQLLRAAQEGRLVWRGAESFAVLQRPADKAVRGSRTGLLRIADRYWHLTFLLGLFLTFVAGTVILAFLSAFEVLDGPGLNLALTLLEIALLLAVLAEFGTALLRMTWRGLRNLIRPATTPDQFAAETLPYEQWTMVMCHHAASTGGQVLLDDVWRRLRMLTGEQEPTLVCPRAGISTAEMRALVAAWSHAVDPATPDPETRVRPGGRTPGTARNLVDRGGFFFLYLVAVVAVLIATAPTVAAWEQAACGAGTACRGRPATTGTALEWLVYRFFWQEPPGLSAASSRTGGYGLLIGLLSVVGVLVAAAAFRQHLRYRSNLRATMDALVAATGRRTRILLLVATPLEQKVVLRTCAALTGRTPVEDFTGGIPVHRLGELGAADVVLARTGEGVTHPDSTAYGLPGLLDQQRPECVISVDICYGLREEKQQLGDVIVGRRLQVVNLRTGEPIVDRGDRVSASHRLISRFMAAADPPGVRVLEGLLLSWDLLIDLPPLRAALKERYPDALGGEMEGAGVYAAAGRRGVDWIIVKGIADWGMGKTADVQDLAATNAATHVLALIESGAFAHPYTQP